MDGKVSKQHGSSKAPKRLRRDQTIMRELFQAAKTRIELLNKQGVAPEHVNITEPERQHTPVLVNMEEYEDWVNEAAPYAMDKRLVRETESKIVGETILVEDIFKDVTSRDGSVKKCGHVMALGTAGMGKTTLLNRIALQGSEELLKGKLILVPEFRESSTEKEVLPFEILLGNMFSDQDSEKMKESYQWMIDNPDKIAFIIDSLDTMPFDLEDERPRIGCHQPATVDVILHNLLTRDLFPESLIISSSREYKVRNLHPSVRPDRCILLDGLEENSVKDLIDGFLGEDKGAEIKEHIDTECPDVWPLLSIPVVLVFSMIGLTQAGFKPKTMSGILVKFFLSLIHSPHTHVKDILSVLRKLMPLSFEGIRKGVVLFKPEDLAQFGVAQNQATDLGILIPQSQGTYLTSKLMQNDRFYLYFKHKTQQECLAALHILSMSLPEFETFIECELYEPNFTVVRRLICGILLNDEVLVGASKLTEIPDVNQKKHLLIKSLDYALKRGESKEKLLELFVDLNESKTGAAELIRSSVREINFSQTLLSPSDVQAVASVMKQCEHLQVVGLWNSNLTEHKFKIFTKTIMKSNLKIDELKIGGNDFGDRGMIRLAKFAKHCEVKSLGILSSALQWERLKAFVDGEKDMKLQKLDVSGNHDLGLKGIYFLGKLVKNHEVKDLCATWCNVKAEHVEKLVEGLGKAKVDILDLEDMWGMPVYGRSLLNLVLHVEKELNLQGWKVSESQQRELQQTLDEFGSPSLTVILGGKREQIFLKASPAEFLSGVRVGRFHAASTHTAPDTSTKFESAMTFTKEDHERKARDQEVSGKTTTSESATALSLTMSTSSQQGGEVNAETASTERYQGVEAIDIVSKISAEIDRRIKTISKKCGIVSPRGGFILNFGSKVTFSDRAFDKDTEVQTSVSTDFSDCPEDRVHIAPIVGCSHSGKLNDSVLVEVEHWAFPIGDNVHAEIYRKESEDSEWRFFKSVPIERNRKISFYTDHFSLFEFLMKCASVASQIWSGLTRRLLPVTLQNLVYISGAHHSIACLCVLKDDKVLNDVTKTLQENGFVALLPLPETVNAYRDEEVKVRVARSEPENLEVASRGVDPENVPYAMDTELSFAVNATLAKCHDSKYISVRIRDGNLKDYDGVLAFHYTLIHGDSVERHRLQRVWPIRPPRVTHIIQNTINTFGPVRTDTLCDNH